MMLHNTVMTDPTVRDLLLKFDDLGTLNPIGSIYKYRALVIGVGKKSQT